MNHRVLSLSMCAVLFIFAGCATSKRGVYYSIDSWAVRDNAVPQYYALYDVFFVYPSMIENPDITYINWTKTNNDKSRIFDVITDYVNSQAVDIFDTEGNKIYKAEHNAKKMDIGRKVRIFSPFIHQVEHGKYIEEIRTGNYLHRGSPVQRGIEDTLRAFEHYFKSYHKKGRPFVLVGQGQGAVDIYEAMKRCRKITPSNGFVAAYLTGLPHVTMEQINKDFNKRGIYAGVNEYDTGVILAWNVRGKHVENSIFTDEDSYAINPLSWRIDGTVADMNMDMGSNLFDFKPDMENSSNEAGAKRNTIIEMGRFTETYVDRGVVIFDDMALRHLTSEKAILDEESLHCHLYSLFNKNIVTNAEKRVIQYQYKQLWHRENISVDE